MKKAQTGASVPKKKGPIKENPAWRAEFKAKGKAVKENPALKAEYTKKKR